MMHLFFVCLFDLKINPFFSMSASKFLLDWLNTLIYTVIWARKHLNLKSYISLNVANIIRRAPTVQNMSILSTHALWILLEGTQKWQNADMSFKKSYLSVCGMVINVTFQYSNYVQFIMFLAFSAMILYSTLNHFHYYNLTFSGSVSTIIFRNYYFTLQCDSYSLGTSAVQWWARTVPLSVVIGG